MPRLLADRRTNQNTERFTGSEEEFGEVRYPSLLRRLVEGDKGVAILLDDDWQPMETYRPSRDYVFIKFATGAMVGSIAVASRGWHPNSYWYSIKGEPLQIGDPYAWKPIPWIEQGFASCQDYIDSIWPPRAVRAAAGHEQWHPADRVPVWEWSSWRLQRGPGQAEDKITHLPIDRLRGCAFIELVCKLPPGPRRVLVYPWRVTEAGAAWLAANPNGW